MTLERRVNWRRRAKRSAGVAVVASVLAAGLAFGLGGAGAGFASSASAQARAGVTAAPTGRMALMRAAARAFGVPARLLLAISYDETRWQRTGGAPSVDGGYGLMNLTTRTSPALAARGDPGRLTAPGTTLAGARYTLDEAARLLRVSAQALKTSDRLNIRGAAAVLAHYARGLDGGALPASLGGWYGAVAEYSGATTKQAARVFADGVFATLRRGASLTTQDGQAMTLGARPGVRPVRAQLARLGLSTALAAAAAADCPSTLNCTFTPAAYAQDSSDPANYGNYDKAGRPDAMRSPSGQTVSMKIRYIIVHDTEGSYGSAISTFQNPGSFVSANYVIRSSDGVVTEMVRPNNVSWGAGDWYVNMHAINIENEGFAAQGATWYTRPEYQSCAALVRYLAARYRIPLDRQHILGHEDVPGPTDSYTSVQHWDPGPFWNWNHFMALVHRVSDSAQQGRGGSTARGGHHLVTIDPTFSVNKQTVTDCSPAGCVTLPAQPANFVYLRTGPGSSYPLIGDPLLHPGGNGTTQDSDWGDKATIGETFVFAGQSGNWTAIWYAGRRAWFYDPPGLHQAARFTGGQVITPKAGLSLAPVYGAAYPEASAYPSAVPPKQVVKLTYTLRPGQEYPVGGGGIATDFYYAKTINSSRPDDHTLIIGKTAYYQISFNHRKFFVPASKVTVKTLT